MNLKRRRVSISEIVILLLKPENYVSNPYFPSVLKENTEIQAKYGADNVETFEYEYKGWVISFKPDQILDDVLVELKVKRPYSREPELMSFAYLQAMLQAYMLGMRRYRIVVVQLDPSMETTSVVEKEYTVDEAAATQYLDIAVSKLEALREILVPLKVEPP